MTFDEMKALMGEGATDDQISLLENKTKLLTQMDKLKKNQVPEGFDVEGYETYNKDKVEFAKKQKELADLELEGKGQWEALKLQLNETHNTALATLTAESQAEIGSLRTALDKELIENTLVKEINSEKGNALFLLPHMKNSVKTVLGEDNKYSLQVVDEEGKQRFADDATTPFTPADLVAEFKANTKYGLAFPELNAGSGGNPDTGGKGGNGVNPWKAETKNVTEQARINRENPTLATQLKKAAGVPL